MNWNPLFYLTLTFIHQYLHIIACHTKAPFDIE